MGIVDEAKQGNYEGVSVAIEAGEDVNSVDEVSS